MGRFIGGVLVLAVLLQVYAPAGLYAAEGAYDTTEDALEDVRETASDEHGDAEEVYASTEEALEELRRTENPQSAGDSVEAIMEQFFPVDMAEEESTYPLSEAVERDFELRRSFPAELGYNGRFYTKYSDENISGVEKWEKEFELNLNYKDLSGYFRFGNVSAFAYVDKPLRWQKGRVDYRWDSGRATVGSYGELFARGLTLNMFEERFLDFDNEVEGVRVRQEVGDAEVTALWGTRKGLEEPRNSEVTAARVLTPVTDELEVGASVVQVRQPYMELGTTDVFDLNHEVIGTDLHWRPGNKFRFFGEVAKLRREMNPDGPPQDQLGEDGLGYYATGVYSVPGFSLAAEYKNYRLMGHPFNVLPPIRRWQEKSTADPNDDVGYGVTMNYSPDDAGSLLTVTYSQDTSKFKHRPYTELLATYTARADEKTSYVLDRWYINDLGEKHEFNRATINRTLDPNWTSTLLVEQERRRHVGLPTYTDWLQIAEVAYQSKFGLVYTVEVTEQELPEDVQSRWKLVELRYHPDQDQEIYLMYGSRREGFVCSGGICRLEPAFSGFRVDYLFRF